MANVALGKKIEEPIKRADSAIDGKITGYTGQTGFAELTWPGYLTVDLGECHTIYFIRILLWDELGQGQGQRSNRIYKYRLLSSVDHNAWTCVYDTDENGYNGWQVFNFPNGLEARFIRVHCLWNSANRGFHVVQLEVHDSDPPVLNAEIRLQRTILQENYLHEIGDGLPIESRIRSIINSIST